MSNNNEYTIGSNKKENSRGPMGGPMGGPPGGMGSAMEKPKDFKKTWVKLLAYCKPYIVLISVALVLAIAATVFTLVGPSQLSKITDLITKGLSGSIDLKAIVNIGILLVTL